MFTKKSKNGIIWLLLKEGSKDDETSNPIKK